MKNGKEKGKANQMTNQKDVPMSRQKLLEFLAKVNNALITTINKLNYSISLKQIQKLSQTNPFF